MRIFYSHAKQLYGTPAEERELAAITARFPGAEVVNPGLVDRPPGEPETDILRFLEMVDACDCLVFSRRRGVVTSGVSREVNHAVSAGKQVYEVRGGEVVRFTGPTRGSKAEALGFLARRALRRR